MTNIQGVELRTERDRIALFVEDGKGDFEPETLAAFRNAIIDDPHGCVIDVGAYTGLYTIMALRAGAREIIALEPNVSGYMRLLQNLEAAGGQPGFIKVLMVAASSHEGEGTLTLTEESKGICSTGKVSLGSPREVTELRHRVKLVRIDDLEHRRPVSVMKLDVEGHELAALSGAALTLEAENPVLFVEVNSGIGGDRTKAVQSFLSVFGYEGEELDGRNMVFRVP